MSKTALITGITGQDGSYLAELLLAKGYSVYGMVRRSSSPTYERIARIINDVRLLEGDLLDMSSLIRVIVESNPDEVYNLAGLSHVGRSFIEPVATMEVTGLGATRLLEALRFFGKPGCKFYQASSSEIIGQADQVYYKPKSPYAAAKLYAHWITSIYRSGYGMYACAGVLYNHESPRRGPDFVTRKITRGIARIKYGLQEKLELGNLKASRDWGYAGDYVQAMWLMLQQDRPKDYMIATGESHTVAEFVELAVKYAGLPHHWRKYVEIDQGLYRPSDVDCLIGDASEAAKDLGWKPTMPFDELVALMMQSDLRSIQNELSTR